MNGILGSVTPWVGLIIGVMIGVMTSLAAAYVKPLIDNQIGKYSSRVRNRNEARRTKWEAEVSSLIGDSEKRHRFRTKANTHFLIGIYFMVVATWTFLISFGLFLIGFWWTTPALGKTIEMITKVLAVIGFIVAVLIFAIGQKEAEQGKGYHYTSAEAEKQVQMERINESGETNADSEV